MGRGVLMPDCLTLTLQWSLTTGSSPISPKTFLVSIFSHDISFSVSMDAMNDEISASILTLSDTHLTAAPIFSRAKAAEQLSATSEE